MADPATEFRDATARLIEDLRAGGSGTGLAVGEAAPLFTLPDAHEMKVSLGDRLAHGPVVLSFYRGAWCPICNTELRGLQEILPDIRALGASLVAISPQAPDKSADLSTRLDLGFDVLSDTEWSVIESYRLVFELPSELRTFYRKFGFGLDEQNADGTWRLPVPATFVLDRAGTVRARHVDPDYSQRMDPQEILVALGDLS